jgi:hypothetical protein
MAPFRAGGLAPLLLSAALLCGCPPSRQPVDDDDTTTGSEPVCEAQPPLEGVCIELAPSATFTLVEAADGVSIPWVLRIEDTVQGVDSSPQDAGGCGRPDDSGLVVFARLSGGGQSYCECDVGLCPAPPPDPRTLQPGEWPGAFAWTGRNWGGPSDTGNPLGEPFPAGTYTLSLSAVGTVQGESFTVASSLALTLE